MTMFKHILMPVDGSLAMLPQVVRCLRFAADAGARVTALHVVAPQASSGSGSDSDSGANAARASQIMQQVVREAAELGVVCDTRVVEDAAPWRAIVDAAAAGGVAGIDLICMASHSRPAIAGQALGSQASQVLVHAAVPVLVLR